MPITLDTSAIAAVIFGEADAARYLGVMIDHVGDIAVSAATWVETNIVLETRQGAAAVQDLELLKDRLGVQIAAVDAATAGVAVAAWQRFGRGRHRAALNFGDCFAYAQAKVSGAALLYKGDDFARTDIASALAPGA